MLQLPDPVENLQDSWDELLAIRSELIAAWDQHRDPEDLEMRIHAIIEEHDIYCP